MTSDAGTGTTAVSPQPAQDVVSGCVGRTKAGTVGRKEGAEEPMWTRGAASQPSSTEQYFLQLPNRAPRFRARSLGQEAVVGSTAQHSSCHPDAGTHGQLLAPKRVAR